MADYWFHVSESIETENIPSGFYSDANTYTSYGFYASNPNDPNDPINGKAKPVTFVNPKTGQVYSYSSGPSPVVNGVTYGNNPYFGTAEAGNFSSLTETNTYNPGTVTYSGNFKVFLLNAVVDNVVVADEQPASIDTTKPFYEGTYTQNLVDPLAGNSSSTEDLGSFYYPTGGWFYGGPASFQLTIDPADKSQLQEAPQQPAAGGATLDPLQGNIQYTDTDDKATVRAAIGDQVISAVDRNGNPITLTEAQQEQLRKDFTIGTPSSTSVPQRGILTWNFQPTNSDFQILPPGSTVTLSSTVSLTDNDSDTDSAVVSIRVSGSLDSLFTDQNDQVDFNNLTDRQEKAIDRGDDLYHSLNGNDVITLPSAINPQLTSNVSWNSSSTFTAGDGDDFLVAGGNSTYSGEGNSSALTSVRQNIVLGSGSDTVQLEAGTFNLSVGLGGTSDRNSTISNAGSAKITLGHGNDTVYGGSGAMVVSGIGLHSTEHTYGGDTIDEAGNSANTVYLPYGSELYDLDPKVEANGSWELRVSNSSDTADFDDIQNFRSLFPKGQAEITDLTLDHLGSLSFAIIALHQAIDTNTRLLGVSKWLKYVPDVFKAASSVASQPDAVSATKKAALIAVSQVVNPIIDQAQADLNKAIPDVDGSHAAIAQGTTDLKSYIQTSVASAIDGMTAATLNSDTIWNSAITQALESAFDGAMKKFNNLNLNFDFGTIQKSTPTIADPPQNPDVPISLGQNTSSDGTGPTSNPDLPIAASAPLTSSDQTPTDATSGNSPSGSPATPIVIASAPSASSLPNTDIASDSLGISRSPAPTAVANQPSTPVILASLPIVTQNSDGSTTTQVSNADGTTTFNFSGLTPSASRRYSSYSDTYAADGTLLSEVRNLNDGSHSISVNAPGQTLPSNFNDTFYAGKQGNTNFVFQPGEELGVIKGMKVGGSNHDTISLLGSDFHNSVASVLKNTLDTAGGAVIFDPTSGDIIRLAGVTKSQLAHNRGDFVFHA